MIKLARSAGGLVLALLVYSASAAAQVPAPPVPSAQTDVLQALERAYDEKNIVAYTALLKDDLIVTRDNEVVARSADEWISEFGRKLAENGVIFEIKEAYQFPGRILTLEYFNSIASFEGEVRHCCWRHDAVQYRIQDGKVSAMTILSGGDSVSQ